jgi:ABC-type multidrug transport system ATPase subunit
MDLNLNKENHEVKNTNLNNFKNYDKKALPLFSMKELSLNYSELKALSEINLVINSGEIVFLTGPSGAGKTSLLKIISGEIKQTNGHFNINSNMKRNKHFFISKVFQDLRFLENKTLMENLMVSYDSSLFNSKKMFMSELEQLSNFLGVSNRLSLLAHQANGGLRQKVAIIRALLSRPDVILADEPSSSLDRQNASRVFDILNYYNVKHNLTVVWASHNHELVKQFTGRILHLNNGKLIYSGHACFI